MNESDANKLAAELKALMPKMTDPQVVAVRNCLRDRATDPAAAKRRLLQYAETAAEFVLAHAETAARDPAPPIDYANRTREMFARQREHAIRLEHHWEEIDAEIAAIDDAKLEELKKLVLAAQPATVVKLVAHKDPRGNRLLKALIAQYLNPGLAAENPERAA